MRKAHGDLDSGELELIVLCITVHLSVTSFSYSPIFFYFPLRTWIKSDSMNFSVVFYSYVNFIEALYLLNFINISHFSRLHIPLSEIM